MAYKNLLDKSTLEDYFSYSPKLGKLFWKKRPSIRSIIGKEAGWIDSHGYRVVRLLGQEMKVHRIIYYLHYGEIDFSKQIDHIDHNTLNNHHSNLRLVTDQENKLNLSKRKTNKSGVVGVHWDKQRKKWFAQIQRNKKTIALGRFDNLEDATEARRQAELTM